MPTPDEIRAAIDTLLVACIVEVETKQQQYKAAQDRHWQGLRTHSTIPADGADTIPDRLHIKPSGVTASWDEMGANLVTTKSCLTVDEYQGPQGAGWVLTAMVRLGGVLWQRAIQRGPETWREQAWQPVPEATI